MALTYGSGASRSETVAAGWELAIGVTLRRADDPVYAGLDAWRLSGDVSVLLVPDGDGYVGQVVGSTPVRAWRDGDVWTVRSDGALWTLGSVASDSRFETVRVEDLLGNVASVGWVDGRPDVVVLGGADPDGDGALDAPATSEVRFVWEETEPWVSGSEGVVRRFDHRLAEVVVAAAGGAPLHALVLTYADLEGAIVLDEVSREGRSGLPTADEVVARFDYTRSESGYEQSASLLDDAPATESVTWGDGITRTSTLRDHVDLDGDGLLDWVGSALRTTVTINRNPATTASVPPGVGGSGFASPHAFASEASNLNPAVVVYYGGNTLIRVE